MAAFNKFNDFAFQLGKGVHQLQAAGHTLNVLLSNTAPNAATNTVKADITEIAAGSGYSAGGADSQNDYTVSSGTGSCTGVDIVWTSAGTIGPFRYAVLYNDSVASPLKPLIGWWDYGSSITLNLNETFTLDIGTSMFTVA